MGVNLEAMKGVEIPHMDWEIVDVLDDIIMVQCVDTATAGHVQRNGILIPIDPAKQLWRVGKVIVHGDKCSSKIKPGVHLLFPNDRGIHVPEVGGLKNIVFLNEERVWGICKAKKKKSSKNES